VQHWERLRLFISELHIFGSGPEERPIKEWIIEKGFADEVHCHGVYPSGQGYVDLISSFDLTLLPTIGEEGAPLVLLESMACGVPFVACNVGGISDYANLDCILCGVDSNDFIEAACAMVSKIKAGQIDRERLQQFYLANFSFLALSHRWCKWLQQIAIEMSLGRCASKALGF
jgi:glycosyltransferase involved in cell wall biosynthesis